MLNKTTGLILAAGNQTRFNDTIPKALYPYNNTNITENNIKHMSEFVDDIVIVTSDKNYEFFYREEYNLIKQVKIMTIQSGYGCGDAVLKSIRDIQSANIILIWGDSIQDNSLLYKLCCKNFYDCDMLIPVVKETNPYVKIITDNKMNVIDIDYSKYSGPLTAGYHDLSMFIFDRASMIEILENMQYLLWNAKSKAYNKHSDILPYRNNELLFLDSIIYANYNGFKIKAIDVTADNITAKSFNSINEYSKIVNK